MKKHKFTPPQATRGNGFGVASLAVCALVGAAISASAATIAYWPLAGENGVRMAQGDTQANSVSGGSDAVAAHILVRNGGVNAAGAASIHADDWPMGTNAFPTSFGVYDPVAKQNLAAASGIDFGRGSFKNNWNSSKNCPWIAGVLRVEDPDEVKASTSFTVEFFVRPDPAYKTRHQVLAAMPLSTATHNDYATTGKASWAIELVNGNIQASLCTGEAATVQTPAAASAVIWDDRWHHVAMTMNEKSFKLFVDYTVVRTSTFTDDVKFSDDGDLFMGGTTHTIYSYAGSMAHFRISDEALTSDKFLHFTRTERAANEPQDVVLHLDFEPVDGLSTNQTVVFNRAATGSAVHLHSNDNWQYPSYARYDTDTYTNKLYSSRSDRNGNVNAHSYSKTNGNQANPYLAWFPEYDLFHDYSFTVEMFLKTSQTGNYKPILRRRPDGGGTNVQVTFGTGSTAGKLSSGFSGFRVADTEVINDGAWHHLSLVYDKEASKIRMFRDWRQVQNDVNVAAEVYTASENPIVILGDPGDNTSFIGKIDDVRITRRALDWKEFMTPTKVKKGMTVIVR